MEQRPQLTTESRGKRRKRVAQYDFRGVRPGARFGTASDRYAGWIGQVYPARYATKTEGRTRTLGGETFREEKVPVASVRDYFEHFEVLELDFTFYRPLLEEDGTPSSNYRALERYAELAPPEARFLVKAPQMYFARRLRRGSGFAENPDFLDAQGCRQRFLAPLRELLPERAVGVIYQQEYQRRDGSPPPAENVEALAAFFDRLGDGPQAHVELRSGHLLTPGYFDFLEQAGLGFVFSHWTWLPMIRKQWRRAGERFTATNGEAVCRLLTPRDTKYADAYAQAHPFDAPVPALSETPQARDMVDDAAALLFQAEAQNATLNLALNNRAWGNAPDLGRAIAERALDEEERRAGS
jgi:uncharacterized protein YecE (DUF72 family)